MTSIVEKSSHPIFGNTSSTSVKRKLDDFQNASTFIVSAYKKNISKKKKLIFLENLPQPSSFSIGFNFEKDKKDKKSKKLKKFKKDRSREELRAMFYKMNKKR